MLIYVSLVFTAGNETTNRLIGWMGKVLGRGTRATAQLVDGRSLVPNAIEEFLRFEPPRRTSARS